MRYGGVPKICGILGLEPMEHFRIAGRTGEYWISDSGIICHSHRPLCADDVANLVNGKIKLYKAPFWSDDDIEFAKCFSKFVSDQACIIFKREGDGTLKWSCDGDDWDCLPWALFSCLQSGETAELTEILSAKQKPVP